MGREICPIFDRKEGGKIILVGAWMQHPVNLRILPDSLMFRELDHIGPMAAKYFSNEPCRQVPNAVTDLGKGCGFDGGGFMMGHDHPAPNEAGGRPGIEFEYVMKDEGGVTVCVREQRPADRRASASQTERPWWQFWR